MTTSQGKDTSSAKTSRFEVLCLLLFDQLLFEIYFFWIHCCLTKFILLWLNDGMHFRQPWVMGVQQEVERLKIRVHEHEKLLRECDEVKAHVRMLLRRVSELERVL